MVGGASRCLALAAALIGPHAARAADALPVLSGRWSAGDCARSAPASTRWFGPGTTGSANDRCGLRAERDDSGFYRAHLTCRYRAAHDAADDVVIEVLSQRALRWVDQCTATAYRFCGTGEPPPLGPPRPPGREGELRGAGDAGKPPGRSAGVSE